MGGYPRFDQVASVFSAVRPDIACVNEEDGSDRLLRAIQSQCGQEWKRVASGPRGSAIYSRIPCEQIGEGAVRLTLSGRCIDFYATHLSPSPYGPWEVQKLILAGRPVEEAEVLKKFEHNTAYAKTYRRIRPSLESADGTLLCGDFNEPSHLDWTARYARDGADRWVANASGTPLKQKIAWKCSRLLMKPSDFMSEIGGTGTWTGLRDAYRVAHPDEVLWPGITWTPPYENGMPGRRPYDAKPSHAGDIPANQVLDRIDYIYFAGRALKLRSCQTVGENGPWSEIAVDPWPSDHRAVVAIFEIN